MMIPPFQILITNFETNTKKLTWTDTHTSSFVLICSSCVSGQSMSLLVIFGLGRRETLTRFQKLADQPLALREELSLGSLVSLPEGLSLCNLPVDLFRDEEVLGHGLLEAVCTQLQRRHHLDENLQ